MPLKIHRFEVYLWPEGTTPETLEDATPEMHTIRVLHIDQLMAERTMVRMNVDHMEHPVHLTDAWVYHALQRTGLYPKDKPLAVFMETDLAGIQKPDGEEATEDVDPTRTGPGNTSS